VTFTEGDLYRNTLTEVHRRILPHVDETPGRADVLQDRSQIQILVRVDDEPDIEQGAKSAVFIELAAHDAERAADRDRLLSADCPAIADIEQHV
jgi:hypothetical protein